MDVPNATAVDSARRLHKSENQTWVGPTMKNRIGAVTFSRRLSRTAVGVAVLTGVLATVATAKSLYVITQIMNFEGPIPIAAYNIGPDGKLTFQTDYGVVARGGGAVGLAIDSFSQSLFVTYEQSNQIQVLSATTMRGLGSTIAPNAKDLAGIVYDHDKGFLYCVDRGMPNLYCYRWDPVHSALSNVRGSPFNLEGTTPYGIALDEIDDQLYVASGWKEVCVYNTSDWSLVRRIPLSHPAISVAVDPTRGFLYTGAGFSDDFYLVQYNLAKDRESEIEVDPEAGVMGLGVDPATGYVYVTTGRNNLPGGKDLLVFDTTLRQIQAIEDIGRPTGLVIPGKNTSYNPLHLTKIIDQPFEGHIDVNAPPQIAIGEEFTYTICFDHNEYDLTDIRVLDTLPPEVAFVSADGDGTFGTYDQQTHTYLWQDPPLGQGTTACLHLVTRLAPEVVPDTIISNSVTIDTAQTPPTTVSLDAVAIRAVYTYSPLNVSKTAITSASDANHPAATIYANPDEEVTYRITFDNANNTHAATNVTLVDPLPGNVSFVLANDNGISGGYDNFYHTYTWSCPRLAAGERREVSLVVRLNKDIAAGTSITNTVTIGSDQTVQSPATAVVVVGQDQKGLRLTKTPIAGVIEDPNVRGRFYVSLGDDVTYSICVGNMSDTSTVTHIAITDTLPREVSFVTVEPNDGTGFYDSKTHTYTWFIGSLAPSAQECVNIVVHVSEQAEPNTVVTNTATVTATQTPPAIVDVNIITIRPLTPMAATMYIKPARLFRTTVEKQPYLMIVVYLPVGCGKETIANVPLVLDPGRIQGVSQTIYGTSTQGKVVAYFDPDPLLGACTGYGTMPLTVTGKLLSGQSFRAEGSIFVLKFGGP